MRIDYLTSGDTEEPLVQARLGAGTVLASQLMSVRCLGTMGVQRYTCYVCVSFSKETLPEVTLKSFLTFF